MAADENSDEVAPEIEVYMKQRCVTDFFHAEKLLAEHLWRSNNECEHIKAVFTVVFSDGDNNVKNKPCSGQPHTAVTPL